MAQYDEIATAYQDSKELPFRVHVERHTVLHLLGDLEGRTVLDLACGEGHYTRRVKRAGAAEITGVDISAEMIRLAEEQERAEPLGCRFVCADAADFQPPKQVDIVLAFYLLNYAGTADKLLRFLEVCHRALRPGGKLIGLNDNVLAPPRGTVSWSEYGIVKTGPDAEAPPEGAPIRYHITNSDGAEFEFENYYLSPQTYRAAFEKAGFSEFSWRELSVAPPEQGNPFWDHILREPPVLPFLAIK